MIYEAKTELTKEDFQAFLSLHKKIASRPLYVFSRVMMGLAVLLALVLAVLIIVFRLWNERDVMLRMLVFVALLLLLPLVSRFTAAQAYKANRSMLGGRYCFGEEQIEAGAESMNARYAYSALSALYHSKGVYYLYVDKAHAFILPERCFTTGDPASFGAWIAAKTGLEMKEIK